MTGFWGVFLISLVCGWPGTMPKSPFNGKEVNDLEFIEGCVRPKGQVANQVPAAEILKLAKVQEARVTGSLRERSASQT